MSRICEKTDFIFSMTLFQTVYIEFKHKECNAHYNNEYHQTEPPRLPVKRNNVYVQCTFIDYLRKWIIVHSYFKPEIPIRNIGISDYLLIGRMWPFCIKPFHFPWKFYFFGRNANRQYLKRQSILIIFEWNICLLIHRNSTQQILIFSDRTTGNSDILEINLPVELGMI